MKRNDVLWCTIQITVEYFQMIISDCCQCYNVNRFYCEATPHVRPS